LAEVSNEDAKFLSQEASGLEGCKAFRVVKKVYGKERTLVACYFYCAKFSLKNGREA